MEGKPMTREQLAALNDLSLDAAFFGIDPNDITNEDDLIMDEVEYRRTRKP